VTKRSDPLIITALLSGDCIFPAMEMYDLNSGQTSLKPRSTMLWSPKFVAICTAMRKVIQLVNDLLFIRQV